MTWAEFQELTLAEYEALEERRVFELRQGRFNAALITSALINSHRASVDSDAVSPYDFIGGLEQDPEDVEADKMRASVKHAIKVAFAENRAMSHEQVLAEKTRMIANMTAEGIEDPEGLFRECFPDL